MKLRIILISAISAIVVLLLSGFFTGFFNKSESYTKTAGINASQVDKITVQTGWGKNITITSKDEINAVITYLDSYKYKRNDFLLLYVGNLYNMGFYNGKKEVATLRTGMYPIINNQKYETNIKMDSDKIQKIVGLYIPKR